jgi:hypothetical protein
MIIGDPSYVLWFVSYWRRPREWLTASSSRARGIANTLGVAGRQPRLEKCGTGTNSCYRMSCIVCVGVKTEYAGHHISLQLRAAVGHLGHRGFSVTKRLTTTT